MRKQKQIKIKHLWMRPLLAVAAVLAVLGSVALIWLTSAAEAPTVTVTFSDGRYRVPFVASTAAEETLYRETGLFSDAVMSSDVTDGGCIVVPGTDFETTTEGLLADSIEQLDRETFYFGEADANGDRWAYTFTGWKIAGVPEVDKIPAKTVFQPGDVITLTSIQEALTAGYSGISASYDEKGNVTSYTLALEAVWGRCYFIQDPYKEMHFAKGVLKYNDEAKYWGVDTTVCDAIENNRTAADDANVGNDPALPKATIDGLYEDLRKQIYTDNTMSMYDAYEVVVMLVGDLHYMKDTDLPGNAGKYYGQITTDTKQVYISATYKSLVTADTPSTGYDYWYKPKGYYCMVYANLRFDNVYFKGATFTGLNYTSQQNADGSYPTATQSGSTEFQLYYLAGTSDGGHNYMEMTARMSETAIATFRPDKHEYVVVNAGSFGFHNQYSSPIALSGQTIYWYVGRKAQITDMHCGTTISREGNAIKVEADYLVEMTGGKATRIHGGSNATKSICIGDRRICLYGDAELGSEYNPTVTSVYGGSSMGNVYGDIEVTLRGCTNVTNVYGGGRDFTAQTYGDVTVNLVDTALKGRLFGGGEYGNTLDDPNTTTEVEGKATVNLQNSTVQQDVYGGGMGQTQMMNIEEIVASYSESTKWFEKDPYYTLEGWEDAPSDFPQYTDDGYVMVARTKKISWTSLSSQSITFYYSRILYYFSVALVQSVEINIQDSTINGNVYGGGYLGKVLGDISITITDSTVKGSLYGGGDGSGSSDPVPVYAPPTSYTYPKYSNVKVDEATGKVTGVNITAQSPSAYTSYPKLGDYTWTNDPAMESGETRIDHENKKLYSPNAADMGTVVGDTVVKIQGDTIVVGDVYGGGNRGIVEGTTSVTVQNGTLENVYAGSNQADIKCVTEDGIGGISLILNGGKIANAYGGNNASGAIAGDIAVTVTNAMVTNLYGGGNLAEYSGTASTTVSGGAVQLLFGGGKQADVGATDVSILGDASLSAVYGGGDRGNTAGNVTVTFSGNAKTNLIYGGANQANITGNVTLTLSGGSVTGEVFGGNNVSGKIGGDITVTAENTSISTLYGGGNLADFAGQVTVSLLEGTTLGALYGGGKEAVVAQTDVTLSGAVVTGALYGGGFEGLVTKSTAVTLTGGSVGGSVYGGGFQGNVTGGTTVSVSGGEYAGNVYGGGYAGTVGGTSVSVIDRTQDNADILIQGSVFGGGEGSTATVLGATDVLIDMYFLFEATENPTGVTAETDTSSGASETEVSFLVEEGSYSRILGNVFGGGDLGQVGDGTIIQSSNIATISTVGKTTVTVRNGYIGKSVFGGGSGVPKAGEVYNVKMGTVFGSTRNNIYGGYIAGSVYGGGTQSRVYGQNDTDLTAQVNIDQNIAGTAQQIFVGGSVFSGGDRGTNATQNASVPTTIGKVEVNINGDSQNGASTIYFHNGGIYGDGNLCLVYGSRTINIVNFHTGDSDLLKTFYSLQRADVVNMSNSRIVLLGAKDLVEEGDETEYSINRVSKLSMEKGSTVKLDQIVKYLGAIESALEVDTIFIDKGNNGENSYDDLGGSVANLTGSLTDAEIVNYYEHESEKNTICVSNGRHLDIINENDEYGPVYGLFTLALLRADPGEGGGFVYASIPLSTGGFICETFMTEDIDRQYIEVSEPEEELFKKGIYYIKQTVTSYSARSSSQEVYVLASQVLDEYDPNETYYIINLMKVIGNVGGDEGEGYRYYYWYISGDTIRYLLGITGLIGSTVTDYPETIPDIPTHSDTLHYVLNSISIPTANSNFADAVVGENKKYDLITNVQTDANGDYILTGQQIALEMRFGTQSLGFVGYDEEDGWILVQNGTGHTGYHGLTDPNSINENIIYTSDVTGSNNNITFVLYKSTAVNAEVTGMAIELQLDLYRPSENNPSHASDMYEGGTSKLIFYLTLAINRQNPVQQSYYASGSIYGSVTGQNLLSLTGQSSFTVNYITWYIPSAFPNQDGYDMRWALSTAKRYYYIDQVLEGQDLEDGMKTSNGFLLTLDGLDENAKAVQLTGNLTFDGSTVDEINTEQHAENTIYRVGDTYQYWTTVGTKNIVYEFVMNEQKNESASVFPKGTKIVMIDIGGAQPVYYYYICTTATDTVDLNDFCLMGSATTIGENQQKPQFMNWYSTQDSVRVRENLTFIFDFSDAEWGSEDSLHCSVEFHHLYGKGELGLNGEGVYTRQDIMDYAKDETDDETGKIVGYTRVAPLQTPFMIYLETNGVSSFDVAFGETEYHDYDMIDLNVTITLPIDHENTMLLESPYIIKMEHSAGKVLPAGICVMLLDQDRNVVGSFSAAYGNRYILIEVPTHGSFELLVDSHLSSMLEALQIADGGVAEFRFTLYSNCMDTKSTALTVRKQFSSATTVNSSYLIHSNPRYDLQITCDPEDRILQAGESLAFELTTKCTGTELDAATPAITVAQKMSGYYISIDEEALFAQAPTLEQDGAYSWQIAESAAAGTYRIAFTYGTCTEYLVIIVE